MSKPLMQLCVMMPTREEDEIITSAAKTDPDALPLTSRQLKELVPIKSLRGRPKAANKKQLVSIRYSPEVLEYFKATGSGWQTRMDLALKEYVDTHTLQDANEQSRV